MSTLTHTRLSFGRIVSMLLAVSVLLSGCVIAVREAPLQRNPQASPSVASSAPASAEKPYTGVTIRRPSLMVRDMQKALSLYRDILGLRVGRLSQDPADSYVYTAFNIPAGTVVWHATFDTDKESRVLSIIEVKAMKPRDDPSALRTSAMLVNANGRLAAIRERLIAEGYKVLPNHALGTNGTEFGFIDNDGHLIALYEFPVR